MLLATWSGPPACTHTHKHTHVGHCKTILRASMALRSPQTSGKHYSTWSCAPATATEWTLATYERCTYVYLLLLSKCAEKRPVCRSHIKIWTLQRQATPETKLGSLQNMQSISIGFSSFFAPQPALLHPIFEVFQAMPSHCQITEGLVKLGWPRKRYPHVSLAEGGLSPNTPRIEQGLSRDQHRFTAIKAV
jgi:hypothetical protein